MNHRKITQAILALSLVVTQQALAADRPGPHAQQRLNEDFLDAVFAKQDIKKIADLIKKGADVNATYQGKTALHFAVENDDKKLAELLLKSGADANAKYKGKTSLYLAVEKGYAKLIDLLLAHGANVNTNAVCGGEGGGTFHCWPLALAIQKKDQKTIKLLVEHGADVHVVKWWEGWNAGFTESALYIAVLMGDKNIAAFLLAHGAKVNEGNPLHAAVSKGDKDMAAFLLKRGADVNKGDPLYEVVSKGDMEMATFLVKHGADVNKKSWGETYSIPYSMPPLYVAVEKGNRSMAELLLKHGAKVNAYITREAVSQGRSPLHKAVDKNDKKMVVLLLKYGANPKQKGTVEGRYRLIDLTPIQLARRTGKKDILKLLQQEKREQRKEKWQKIMKKK